MKTLKDTLAFASNGIEFKQKMHPVRDEYRFLVFQNGTRIHNTYPYKTPFEALVAAETWAINYLEFSPHGIKITDHKILKWFYCLVILEGEKIGDSGQFEELETARKAAAMAAREYIQKIENLRREKK